MLAHRRHGGRPVAALRDELHVPGPGQQATEAPQGHAFVVHRDGPQLHDEWGRVASSNSQGKVMDTRTPFSWVSRKLARAP